MPRPGLSEIMAQGRIKSGPHPGTEMSDLQIRLLLGPLVTKDPDLQRIGKLRLLQFPNREWIVLLRKAGLHELRSRLEDVALHQGTGVEVDHQRPSRSASTAS